jgi:hypothetical protein
MPEVSPGSYPVAHQLFEFPRLGKTPVRSLRPDRRTIELYLAKRRRMLADEIQHLAHIDEASAIHL